MAKRILVPLDGSLTGEWVLPLVAEAARGGGATVRLLQVAPIPDNVVSTQGHVIAYSDQEMARQEAEALDYLRMLEARFDGIPVECRVRFGDPVETILQEADAFSADLIAVTTVGRSGVARAALGSVADRVFRKADAAVLMFRPPREYLG
jgi:nucleotide-binding universal stress UspA family protein